MQSLWGRDDQISYPRDTLMRNASRLFMIVAKASLIATTVLFGLVLAVPPLLHRHGVPRVLQAIAVAIAVFIPIGASAWWMFRKLQSNYTQPEARKMAIA